MLVPNVVFRREPAILRASETHFNWLVNKTDNCTGAGVGHNTRLGCGITNRILSLELSITLITGWSLDIGRKDVEPTYVLLVIHGLDHCPYSSGMLAFITLHAQNALILY